MVVRLYGWWCQRQRVHQRRHVHVGWRWASPEYNILAAVVVAVAAVVVVVLLTIVRR